MIKFTRNCYSTKTPKKNQYLTRIKISFNIYLFCEQKYPGNDNKGNRESWILNLNRVPGGTLKIATLGTRDMKKVWPPLY